MGPQIGITYNESDSNLQGDDDWGRERGVVLSTGNKNNKHERQTTIDGRREGRVRDRDNQQNDRNTKMN